MNLRSKGSRTYFSFFDLWWCFRFPRNWYELITTINCSIRIHVFQKQKWSNSMSLGKAYIFHQKLEIHCPYCNHSSLSEHSLLFCNSKLVHFTPWNRKISTKIAWQTRRKYLHINLVYVKKYDYGFLRIEFAKILYW